MRKDTKKRGHYRNYTGIKKVCEHCHKGYIDVLNRRLKYCSLKCYWLDKRLEFFCKSCGKKFITTRTRNTVFCGKACETKYKTGKKRPCSVGEAISKAKLKGTIPSDGRRIRKLARFMRCRKKVLDRDCFTCQICFKSGIETHHIKTIKENPELAYDTKNLITLCKQCHDDKVSRKEKKWEKHFYSILKLGIA